jgi:rhodanese-related sulfurtransferase
VTNPTGFVTALAIFFSILCYAATVLAGGEIIAADEALARAEAGRLTIVDVRSPAEWRQTGIASGARLATIHNRKGPMGFLEEITALVDGDKSRPIAMICARGYRSAAATAFLREQGFTNVFDIREGMLGRDDRPGWLARDLPVEPCEEC